MKLNEIRESGLLELYVLGELSSFEQKEIEDALIEHPSLKKEIKEIEATFKMYANAHAINPPANILTNLLSEAKATQASSDQKVKEQSLWSKYMPIAALIGLIGLSLALYFKNSEINKLNEKYNVELEECDELRSRQSAQIALLENINNKNNEIIFVEATPKYPNTQLYIHHNPIDKKNYIQVQNLPGLADNQSYQLWSLKGDLAPIPLDVFQDSNDAFFEVKHVEDTNAYAITIEPKGGKNEPTLENLIGVFKIG